MKTKKMGYTYLIHAENMYRFKIGCAGDIEKRFKSLQTCSPVKLYLVGKKKTKDMYGEEKKWHSLFSTKRKRGEWFDLSHKDIIKIASNWKTDIGIHWRDRTVDNLIVGNTYYISFNSKKVIPVILDEICEIPPNHVVVSSKKENKTWVLFDDEVRATEIAAIFNRVTF